MSTYKVQDNSANGVGTVVQLLQHFFPYAQKQLGFHKPVMISFDSDEDNAGKLLGRTGQYNPDDFSISIYVDSRHPKDILRSLSHELVHHAQNCNGDFDSAEPLGAGYAQENPAMRNAELDAYKRGNIIFRDFEDLIKKGKINVNINFEEAGEPKMSLKEWKHDEINTLLMEKWGYGKKAKTLSEEDKEKIMELAVPSTESGLNPAGYREEDKPKSAEEKEAEMLRKAGKGPRGKSFPAYKDPKEEEEEELEEVSYRKEQQRPSEPEEEEKLEEFKGIPAHREKQRALKGMSADPKAQCRELQAKISQLEGDLADSIGANPHGQAGQYISQDLHTAQKAAKKAGCGLAENLEESEDLEDVKEEVHEEQPVAEALQEGGGALDENSKISLTLDEARDVARRIFERITQEKE